MLESPTTTAYSSHRTTAVAENQTMNTEIKFPEESCII